MSETYNILIDSLLPFPHQKKKKKQMLGRIYTSRIPWQVLLISSEFGLGDDTGYNSWPALRTLIGLLVDSRKYTVGQIGAVPDVCLHSDTNKHLTLPHVPTTLAPWFYLSWITIFSQSIIMYVRFFDALCQSHQK